MPPFYPLPERIHRVSDIGIEHALRQYEARMSQLAAPGHLLTTERLPRRYVDAAPIINYAHSAGIEWPSHDTAVPVHLGSRLRHYFVPDASLADSHFVFEAMYGRQAGHHRRGFNNYSAILRSRPFKPNSSNEARQAMSRDPAGAIYGSKPYLLRAYMIAPEFMGSLQAAVADCGGTSEWVEALIRGGLEGDEYPKDAALLRASRLAYGLLANLMRTDDLQRQSQWLGFGETKQLINDPEIELWT